MLPAIFLPGAITSFLELWYRLPLQTMATAVLATIGPAHNMDH